MRKQNTTEESELSKAKRERDEALLRIRAEKRKRRAMEEQGPWWIWLAVVPGVLVILGLVAWWFLT